MAEGGKKKRRRRKADSEDAALQEASPAAAPAAPSAQEVDDLTLDDLQDGDGTYSLMDRPLLDAEMAVMKEDAPQEVAEADAAADGTKAQKPLYSFDPDLQFQLPVESESKGDIDSSTPLASSPSSQEVVKEGKGLALPELKDSRSRRKKRKQEQQAELEAESSPISRKDIEEFKKMLDLEPQLEPGRILPEEEVDLAALVLGVGARKFFFVERAYLQAGHLVLTAVVLLCAFVEYPGLPLTELPYELRDFLKAGLAVVFAINAVLAGAAGVTAKGLGNQPVGFWVGKTFLLGGLAYDQVTSIADEREEKAARAG
eukprot:CAMPEP_0194725294 /NCGR_PEP_ID=MMETSP0296-20130528/25907_1 /TAXON_ID=39354 /ORGANISM="Heterosigma akashiwo, Strain CCMP2393" /LENGTH=314 /DNA_ID=CAMNT_0039629693 /DNA_START=174 /DNA_END=1114 /DNA_ORIENTATION=+